MGYLVVSGGQVKCSMGTAPCSLSVIRPTVKAGGKPAANVMDYKPFVNMASFGMCNATANPQVISLTAAALGVHTPAPCIPNVVAPWSPGAKKVKLDKFKALDDGSKCNCLWSGSISVSSAGQTKVKVN